MRFSIPSFALIAAALALAQPGRRQGTPTSINPAPEVAKSVDWAALDAASNAGATTNAQRLARGLPLLKPKAHRRYSQRGAPHRLGSRVQSAPRADTSPLPPATQKCNILVKTSDATLGFITPVFNTFGEYGQFQQNQAGALEVSFSYPSDSSTPGQLDLLATNGPSSTFPYVGAAVGYAATDDNFGPSNYNYAYVAGTKQTPPGSPAMVGDSSFGTATGIPADYESAIWVYDTKTQAITAQWINSDGSAPATELLYANDGNDAILLTGDAGALNDTFGTGYPVVTFTCVPPVVTPTRV